jgi:hypothetical protein
MRKHYYKPPSLLGENSCGDVLYDRSHAYGPRPDREVGPALLKTYSNQKKSFHKQATVSDATSEKKNP